ncbi:hypothetical protein [Raoultibacter massiliensis]|uniref:hypothetical protein n=1 Tax=Raoultibacter massiliensis TaxID=1852371 RepID=UPI003A94FBB4
MHEKLKQDDFRGRVAFVGETLGPLFLQDPVKGDAQTVFAAIADLDPLQAGCEWPFVDDASAQRLLGLMVEGLGKGIDDDALVWEYRFLLFDGCNYRSLLFTNPLFRGLFHF